MATTLTSSLTGKTVRLTDVHIVGGWTLPVVEAEVLATCFNLRDQVEAVEVFISGQGRVTVFRDAFEVAA
jgi:hypothetical protein